MRIADSDVHYRAGVSPVGSLPQTLGHEVAGVVEEVGPQVANVKAGDRVCLHYLITCGDCYYCSVGSEQFCVEGAMIGKHRDGGYAEYIAVPARSAVLLPDEIPFEQGAVMMCSSATSLHALRKSRFKPGETAAIFGAGGLGLSAIQLARAFGGLEVYAVDINENKLALAEGYGAIPVNGAQCDPVAEVIGCNDHLLQELPLLIEFARRGQLDLSDVITRTVGLDADAINEAMEELERFGGGVRTVITP